MSSVRTFIAALKTGETRTTKALQRVAGRRQGAAAQALIAALKHKGALDAPLGSPLRDAIQKTPLPERYIARCIDDWPDVQKEQARKAMVTAINKGHQVRFRWGLKSGPGYDTNIHRGVSSVTITALSPRSSLRVSGNEIHVAPGGPAKRGAG
jgi:hypothetical protein